MTTETQDIADLIAELNEQTSPVERSGARLELIRIGNRAVPALVAALDDPDARVRWEAGKALAHIGDPVAAEALVAHLADVDSDVRWVLGVALLATGRAAVIPLLRGLLDTQQIRAGYEGVHLTLRGFAKDDLQPILEPVINALDSHEPEIATPVEAQRALERLRGRMH
jgi:HEAT repeat protein